MHGGLRVDSATVPGLSVPRNAEDSQFSSLGPLFNFCPREKFLPRIQEKKKRIMNEMPLRRQHETLRSEVSFPCSLL